MNRNYAFLLIFFAFAACENKECEIDPEIAAIPVEVSIERKEVPLFESTTSREVRRFLEDNPTLADYFLDANQYPSDSVLANQMIKLIPHLDSLQMEVDRKFGDITWLESQYVSAFQHLKYYYPTAKTPKVQTMVTGFYRDIYFSDSLLVIGLDFFIGNDSKYKPDNVPAYIARRFKPDYIVPASFFFLSDYYNKVDYGDNTLLNEMITAGKTFYFTERMVPCAPDSIIIGFSEEELREVHKNEDVVWANFVQNQLLYETEPKLINKFMGERPNVYEIGEKCPGRIGAWVGWEIVRSYMENNPKVTLQELMEEDDPKKIFTLSKYRPNPH
jgi:gliding motility-associated lipoprotein GldB